MPQPPVTDQQTGERDTRQDGRPGQAAGRPVHRLVPSPAGRIHLVEQGSGPLVLLVHGFPESWYLSLIHI